MDNIDDTIKTVIITNGNYKFTLPVNRIPINSMLESCYKFISSKYDNNSTEIILPFSLGTMRLIEHYFYDFSHDNKTLKKNFYWPNIYNLDKDQQFHIDSSDLIYLNYRDFLLSSVNIFPFLHLSDKFIKFLELLPMKNYFLLLPIRNQKLYATKTFILCLSQTLCLNYFEEYDNVQNIPITLMNFINQSFKDDFKIIDRIINPANKEDNITKEFNLLLSSINQKITYLHELYNSIDSLFTNKIYGTKTITIKDMTYKESEYIVLLYNYFNTLIKIIKLYNNDLIKTNKNKLDEKFKIKIKGCKKLFRSYDLNYVQTIEYIYHELCERYPKNLYTYFKKKSCNCNTIHKDRSSINDILNTTYDGCSQKCTID